MAFTNSPSETSPFHQNPATFCIHDGTDAVEESLAAFENDTVLVSSPITATVTIIANIVVFLIIKF